MPAALAPTLQAALPALLLALPAPSASAASAASLQAQVQDQRGRPVADAVIIAIPQDPRSQARPHPSEDAIDQVDKQFVPYVKVVPVGTKIRFPNSDKVRHQVYSFSEPKRFELPLYGGREAPPVEFDAPGIVVLGCNIHDWMIGYVYVTDAPFFGKTGAAGTAMLDDLPPGEYLVRVWHPGMQRSEESTARRITIAADGAPRVAWQLELKPSYRVPRVSGAASPAYP